jgi:hypothetical protein
VSELDMHASVFPNDEVMASVCAPGQDNFGLEDSRMAMLDV